MIPGFNGHGLLPPGEHLCTLAEAQTRFSCNAHREHLWKRLCDCLAELLEKEILGSVIVDGSYVTDKETPGDIEICIDARGLPESMQGRVVMWYLRRSAHWNSLGISIHANVDGTDLDFTIFFQYLGPKTAAAKRLHSKDPKGILRLRKL